MSPNAATAVALAKPPPDNALGGRAFAAALRFPPLGLVLREARALAVAGPVCDRPLPVAAPGPPPPKVLGLALRAVSGTPMAGPAAPMWKAFGSGPAPVPNIESRSELLRECDRECECDIGLIGGVGGGESI